MAERVAESLASGRHLLIEAGTGIGKSLAYLLPAILHAVSGDEGPRRVVVSTFTRALQEQLARHDLPLLERALEPLGVRFRHALLMGSENYLCVQRLAQARLHGGPGPTDDLARHAQAALSGLRGAIPFEVPDALWARVRRDRDVCLGARGPFWDECLYRRDLMLAREAEIVVVNHALFFLDLALGQRILPPHTAVVLDEAHRAEEAAASQFGTRLGPGAVTRLLGDLRQGDRRRRRRGSEPDPPASAAAVRHEADAFFTAARILLRRAAQGPSRTAALPPGVLPREPLAGALERLEETLARDEKEARDPEAKQTLTALGLRTAELRKGVDLFVRQPDADAVYWVESRTSERDGDGAVSLQTAPIEIAPILRRRLFESGRTVVLTSATLTVAGSFAHARDRLGLTTADEQALGSPYDYRRQALLYLPPAVPDPGADPDGFAEAVAHESAALVAASDGGALLLFTSYALLERVHAVLATEPGMRDRPLLKALPDGPMTALLERFRSGRRAVLLGALGFWQGIDVPGEALRMVVVTRLPFEVPGHPATAARAAAIAARGGDAFLDDSLPEAVLTFRQGFGRLVRSRQDRGVVAVLDPRLRTRAYGATFLESLPPCPRTSSIEDVAGFFRDS
jgi:ATP-dependent DNA helicase DinG